ncbi:hypothetical protein ACOI1C_02445 [Bacillus sp. DJP31]|uniref:YqgU-like beta propeller domain-containing protein n=1 Tax=Bacillus sp. DJP31 TaxID=3409789 RepID=UPI003BB53F38
MVKIAFVCMIALQFFILSGCSSFKSDGNVDAALKETNSSFKEGPSGHFFGGLSIIPIELNGSQFNSIGDWYDNTTILYITDDSDGSKIYKYHLYTGVAELFYETTEQIITLKASQDRSYFALQTSVSSNEAKVTIVDQQGKEKMSTTIDSVEIQYVWNPFKEMEVFITSFQEDWSFQNYVLDVNQNLQQISEVSQPFVQWVGPTKIAYLKWENDGNLNAPLLSLDSQDNVEIKILDSVLAYRTYKDLLVTISGTETESLYQFFDTEMMQLKGSFKLPMINTFSDRWWIPNYDYDSETDSFIYFKPKEENNELASLQLMKFSLINGEETLVLEDSLDRPLNISPDGTLCLIGYQLEEIIDMKKKEISSLIKQM